MILLFDCETTGLFKDKTKDLNWEKDYKDFPYIVSLSWKTGKKVNGYIIHQEGRKIPKEAIAIHGITDAMATKGKTLKYVLDLFIADAIVADKVMAYNVYFDTSMIKAETLRAFGPQSNQATEVVEALHKDKRIDPMRIGHRFMKKPKWPSLTELHTHLFGSAFDGAHTSGADILAMEKCYNKMISLGAE